MPSPFFTKVSYNLNNKRMKDSIISIVAVVVAIALFSSCEEELEGSLRLGEQLAGEWDIVQMYFPENDSTVAANGQAVFDDCINCDGYFVYDGEVINFSYTVTHSNSPDIHSQISMGPSNEEQMGGNNALKLHPSTFPILAIDENNLTINLAFCTYDADSSCITTHRHIVMTR